MLPFNSNLNLVDCADGKQLRYPQIPETADLKHCSSALFKGLLELRNMWVSWPVRLSDSFSHRYWMPVRHEAALALWKIHLALRLSLASSHLCDPSMTELMLNCYHSLTSQFAKDPCLRLCEPDHREPNMGNQVGKNSFSCFWCCCPVYSRPKNSISKSNSNTSRKAAKDQALLQSSDLRINRTLCHDK